MLELLDARRRRRRRARRRRGRAARGARARSRDHVCVYMEVDAETAWERAGESDGRWRATGTSFERLHAQRRRCTSRSPRASCPAGDDLDERAARLRQRGAAAAGGAAVGADGLGARRRGLPGVRRRRACCAPPARSWPRRAAASWSRTRRRTRCTASVLEDALAGTSTSARRSRSRRASATRRWPRPSACCARWPRAGMQRADTLRRLRRRRRGRPRRLLRGRLPARRGGRAGADHAGRPGRLGLRRQDGRRPARGQELRRRLPPAGRGVHRPGAARHPARRRSFEPASPR